MNERVLHNEVKKLDAEGKRQLAATLLEQATKRGLMGKQGGTIRRGDQVAIV